MSAIVQTSNSQHASYIPGENKLSDVKEQYVSYIDDVNHVSNIKVAVQWLCSWRERLFKREVGSMSVILITWICSNVKWAVWSYPHNQQTWPYNMMSIPVMAFKDNQMNVRSMDSIPPRVCANFNYFSINLIICNKAHITIILFTSNLN